MLLRDGIRDLEWSAYKQKRKRKLKNNDFSIISSNCIGMFMYKDMRLKYLSPTINLCIPMNDFVTMVENLKWYMEQEVTQAETKEDYPVGYLGDVEIRFMHYGTFEEAAWKWEERKKRINWDNLFIAGVEKDGCTYETIRRFQQLPYKNKVIFTHVRYPEFPAAYYIKGFENNFSESQ